MKFDFVRTVALFATLAKTAEKPTTATALCRCIFAYTDGVYVAYRQNELYLYYALVIDLQYALIRKYSIVICIKIKKHVEILALIFCD